MKKIVFILLGMLFILSCQDQVESMKQFQVGADGKVEVELTVQVPNVQLPNSRALTEKPYIFHLYLAVFDEAGYLLEYVKADVNPAVENNVEYTYKVKLSPTSYPTTIHYIANGPTSVNFGTETEVVGNMSTWGETDAYWQKVDLPEGIKVITVNENKVLDNNVRTKLTGIRLIRNFSWIKLQDNAENFVLESFCVVNTRTRGSVAPYNASKQEFVNFKDSITHDSLVANGYEAYIPGDAELNKLIPIELYWGADYFIYERERPKADPLFILMKGTYKPENGDPMPGRYYKVDLRDANGDYFPVLRNFRYQVNLNNIKHAGHATSEAAAQGAGSGDVSTSIETENLNNISNSVIRLWVSYTDKMLVSNESVTLKYKFVNLADATTALNNEVEIKREGLSEENKVIAEIIPGSDDSDGWRTITISPVAVSSQRKTETITLVGTARINEQTYTLQRKVKFTLREKMNFDLVCDPDSIMKKIGDSLDLVIKVPGGLGNSIFPLDFEIEAVEQSITPNLGDNLPVVTGKSIVPYKDKKTTIGFIKSVSWDEYEDAVNEGGYKAIRCHFKSNRAESATQIYAQNEYFNLDSVYLGNYVPGEFTNLKFEPSPITSASQSVEFSFNMSKQLAQGYVTVTLDGLEPADSEQKLTYLGVKDGKAQYEYDPVGLSDHSFNLQPTVESGIMTVTLEAYRFTAATKSTAFGRVIPAGHIKVGNKYNNIGNAMMFELYTSNPKKQTNVTPFASFTANSNGSNPSDIVVTNEVYNQIKNGTIYVRYSIPGRYSWSSRTYYVADVSLDELINGAVNLDFEKQ